MVSCSGWFQPTLFGSKRAQLPDMPATKPTENTAADDQEGAVLMESDAEGPNDYKPTANLRKLPFKEVPNVSQS